MSDEIKCFWIERVESGGFRRPDTGAIADGMDGFGPGALFAEPETPEAVHVLTPGGWANLLSWQRAGDPRKPETFSVAPSIQILPDAHGRRLAWHGFLKDGVLRNA